MTLYFFLKTCFNKGAAAATGCLSLLGAVYLPFGGRSSRKPVSLRIGPSEFSRKKNSALLHYALEDTPFSRPQRSAEHRAFRGRGG